MVEQGTIEVYLLEDISDNPQRCVITRTKYAKESDKWIAIADWEHKRSKKTASTKKET